VKTDAPATEWGRKAAGLYHAGYARRYREHDDALAEVEIYGAFSQWLRGACLAFDAPIDVLDLGCGTGRYFAVLPNVRSLVGIDASAAMLTEAGRPLHGERVAIASIELIEGDFLTHEFETARFDLVYSVGVLAEHTPLDPRIVGRVARWLRPGGRFAFTTVHPKSPSIPRTIGRSVGTAIAPWARGAIQTWLRHRILGRGLYADETRIHELLDSRFTIESLTRMTSEAHLHALCVARKTT
jgi:SAM-dependent methyltransferase